MHKEAERQRPKLVATKTSQEVAPQQQLRKRRKVQLNNSVLENLNKRLQQVIENVDGEELENQLLSVQNIVSLLNKVKREKNIQARSPFGRKLLSLDQCDSEDCSDPDNEPVDTEDTEEPDEIEENDLQTETSTEKNANENTKEDENDMDEDENEDEEEDEDGNEDEEIDDEDLLDAEALGELLANKDLDEKISTMNNVLDDLERVMELNLLEIDRDLYVSAIQSLIVYIYAVEEMQEVPHSKQSSLDLVLLQELSDRMKVMKKTYLSQVTHFEMFFSNSYEIFKEIIEDKIFLDRSNKEAVDKINEFSFNFHYASEIEKIIRRRAIEDETDIIDEFQEDLGLMRQVYEHLGFGEETQDEGYFSRVLSGLVSEDEDDEETHKNRRLLSIPDEDLDEGYCSKDDLHCDRSSESVLKKEVKVSDVDMSLTDLEKCDGLLKRAQQIGQYSLQDDKLASFTGKEKIEYIKSFITKLKDSRMIVREYQELLKTIVDPQDYHQCYNMMEEDLGKLKKQTGNTNWLKHLSSLIASNDKEVLSELTGMLQDKNIESESPTFRKRNLLSVNNEEFCEKDDVECKERSSLTNDPDLEQQYSNKEEALENLMQELEDSYEEIKVGHVNKKGKKSDLFRCEELLTKSQQEMTKFQKNEAKNKNLKKMKPKEKIKLIRGFMTQMTRTKNLLDEHQKISSEIKNHRDQQLCQPLLKVSGSRPIHFMRAETVFILEFDGYIVTTPH